MYLFFIYIYLNQWLNYSELGGGTLNSGVNVELIPVAKFSGNGPERQLEVPERSNFYNVVKVFYLRCLSRFSAAL